MDRELVEARIEELAAKAARVRGELVIRVLSDGDLEAALVLVGPGLHRSVVALGAGPGVDEATAGLANALERGEAELLELERLRGRR